MYHTFNWVVLKLDFQDETFYKVLAQVDAGMNGWRINSGISKVEEDEEFYYFYGASGSCYQCEKAEEKISRTTGHILNRIKELGDVKVVLAKDIENKFLLVP